MTIEQQKAGSPTERERALRRIAKAVRAVLRAEQSDAALEQALRIIGMEAGCDRVCVFEGIEGIEGVEGNAAGVRTRVRTCWVHEGNICRKWEVLMQQQAAARWMDQLRSGEAVQIQRDALPDGPRAILEEDETHTLLLLPIRGHNDRWGGLCLDTCRRPRRWTHRERTILRTLARELGPVLLQPATDEETSQSEGQRSPRITLSRVDQVLVDVGRLLVSDREFHPEELLERVGEALEADHVYLVTLPPDLPSSEDEFVSIGQLQSEKEHAWLEFDAYTYHEWRADPEHFVTEDDAAQAVPILSQSGMLYGYLGIDHAGATSRCPQRDTQALYVLGDMLSTYFERQRVEAALRESRKRYRAFVSAIIEGIWAIEVEPPIDVERPLDDQLQALRARAVLVECNEPMAQVVGADTPAAIIGQPAADVTPEGLFDAFFTDLLTLGYTLRNREYTLHGEAGSVRYFRVNALGAVEGGKLTRVWGSWTDVTDRVELERRMVTALEQQQQRIGRELHDGVGQLLTGINMLGQNLLDRDFQEGEEGYARTQKILRFTRDATRLVRELQRGLTPVQAHSNGELVEALSMLAGSTDGLPGIACTFRHDGQAQVEEQDVGFQVYRIAQEATNNALKHAAPSAIEISFSMEEGCPVLQVRDDGCGFDLSHPPDQSLGLHSMRYRARSIGAGFDIDSSRGIGTTVRCVLSPSL